MEQDQLFEDGVSGISMMYPGGWRAQKSENALAVFECPTAQTEPLPSMNITYLPTKGASLEQFTKFSLEQMKAIYKPKKYDMRDTTLGDLPAKEWEYHADLNGKHVSFFQRWAIYGTEKRPIVITFTALEEDYSKYLPDARRCVDTFKFIAKTAPLLAYSLGLHAIPGGAGGAHVCVPTALVAEKDIPGLPDTIPYVLDMQGNMLTDREDACQSVVFVVERVGEGVTLENYTDRVTALLANHLMNDRPATKARVSPCKIGGVPAHQIAYTDATNTRNIRLHTIQNGEALTLNLACYPADKEVFSRVAKLFQRILDTLRFAPPPPALAAKFDGFHRFEHWPDRYEIFLPNTYVVHEGLMGSATIMEDVPMNEDPGLYQTNLNIGMFDVMEMAMMMGAPPSLEQIQQLLTQQMYETSENGKVEESGVCTMPAVGGQQVEGRFMVTVGAMGGTVVKMHQRFCFYANKAYVLNFSAVLPQFPAVFKACGAPMLTSFSFIC